MRLRVPSHYMCTARYLFCFYEYERGVDQQAAKQQQITRLSRRRNVEYIVSTDVSNY